MSLAAPTGENAWLPLLRDGGVEREARSWGEKKKGLEPARLFIWRRL